MQLLATLLGLALCAQHVTAVTWYYLTYRTPTNAYISSFSGKLVAPTLPGAATYYLWPGLQPPDNAGVLQQVLDGRSGEWWIGSGWCCSNPSLSWGSGFNVPNGQTVSFSNKVNSIAGGTWATSLTMGGNTATGSFPLPTHPMNQAIMAIELYDVSWTFGAFAFENVVITANTSSTAWCTNGPINYNNAAKVSISKPTATISGATSTCSIAKIVLESPA